MDAYERRRMELLEELARRFRDSSGTMRGIAQRIRNVAHADAEARRRLGRANRELRDCLGSAGGALPFSRLEFIEFSSADEFRRFREQPAVSQDEIAAVDWDELARRLQE